MLNRTRNAVCLLLAGMACSTAMGQSNTPTDVSARTVMMKVLAKAGIALPYTSATKFDARGNLRLYGGTGDIDAEATFHTLQNGTTFFEAKASGMHRTVTLAGGHGALTSEINMPAHVPLRNALISNRIYHPTVELAEIVSDPKSAVTVIGPTVLAGRSSYVLDVTGHWDDVGLDKSTSSPSVEFIVDASTLNITGRVDHIEDQNDGRTRYERAYFYDDYRTGGGITYPNTITEFLEGQKLSTLTWDSVQISF